MFVLGLSVHILQRNFELCKYFLILFLFCKYFSTAFGFGKGYLGRIWPVEKFILPCLADFRASFPLLYIFAFYYVIPEQKPEHLYLYFGAIYFIKTER
jgi:hypothetical protein